MRRSTEVKALRLLTERTYWESYSALRPQAFDILPHVYEWFRVAWEAYDGADDKLPLEFLQTIVENEISITGKNDVDAYEVLSQIYDMQISETTQQAVERLLVRAGAKAIVQDVAQGSDEPDLERLAYELRSLARNQQVEIDYLDPFIDWEELLDKEATPRPYPTHLSLIDKALEGGLWAAEIGLIYAPTYRGKTAMLVHLGDAAMRSGFPVFYASCESPAYRFAFRLYQAHLGISRHTVKEVLLESQKRGTRPFEDDDLPPVALLDLCVRFPTLGEIRQSLQRFLEVCDQRPLVIIDAMLDRIAGRSDDWRQLGRAVEGLRVLAREFEVGIWTTSQVQRGVSDLKDDGIIGLSNVGRDISISELAEVVLTLNQTAIEKRRGIMKLFIAKAKERMVTDPLVGVQTDLESQRFFDMPTEPVDKTESSEVESVLFDLTTH